MRPRAGILLRGVAIVAVAAAGVLLRPPRPGFPRGAEPLSTYLASPESLLAIGLLAVLLPAALGSWRAALAAGSVVAVAAATNRIDGLPPSVVGMADVTAVWGALLVPLASLGTVRAAPAVALGAWAAIACGVAAERAASPWHVAADLPTQLAGAVGGILWGAILVLAAAALHRAWLVRGAQPQAPEAAP